MKAGDVNGVINRQLLLINDKCSWRNRQLGVVMVAALHGVGGIVAAVVWHHLILMA